MRGEIKYKILDLLEDGAMGTIDFVGAFLSAGYGASAGKITYEYEKRVGKRINRQLDLYIKGLIDFRKLIKKYF